MCVSVLLFTCVHACKRASVCIDEHDSNQGQGQEERSKGRSRDMARSGHKSG